MKKLLLSVVMGLMSSAAFAVTPFNLPWVNNPARDTVYKTTDHADGVFVMEFFANFCGACNDNAVNVDALSTAYAHDARVQVLDMSLDSSDREIATWIANHAPNHPVLKDVGRTVWNQIHAQYIPTVVITDCHGTEKYRSTGGWDESITAQIHSTVDALLAAGCN